MTDAIDLDAIDAAVSAAPVTERAELPPPPPETPVEAPDGVSGDIVPPKPELILESAFLGQWGLMHDMAGGMVHARTGVECPLGEMARNEGGLAAGKALYQLLLSNPTLARMVLGTESTFIGQILAIGMHGFNCVQVVKASTMQANVPFKATAREEAA